MHRWPMSFRLFSVSSRASASTAESQLMALLSQPKLEVEPIFSLYSTISEPLLFPSMTLSVLRLAIQEQKYSISKHIISYASASLYSMLSVADYERLMVEADKNGDHLGQQNIFEMIECSPNCPPTVTILNSFLSGGLTHHTNSQDKLSSTKVDEWIIRILRLFKANSLHPNSATIEIILTHCILNGDWKTVVSLLEPSLGLLQHVGQSTEFIQFLLYELGAAGLPKLVVSTWRLFCPSDETLFHLIALDALISSNDAAIVKDVSEVFNTLLTVIRLPKSSPVHGATLASFGSRVCSLLLRGARIDLLLSHVVTMKKNSIEVGPLLFFRIFDGILSQASSPEQGFEHLAAFVAGLVQELGPESLSPDLRAALIKIASRHHVPSSFMDQLERLEKATTTANTLSQ
ncbi:hypothetical protein MDAP_001170 [Mitosporidium daphniae]|uniref:Uncharacterized protein n=1 Tax=Mitosporidium daphniae TaxID=1485682 RepID=A0A098VU34_9MICR|nr:uncharacterized protein DI09_16p260 [Mitosporidium daphniae]KGG52472.1 hypothetical protein DI09_16p260 [Mitosporidium daphniae]|eukprot:XP_013238899.1 uncharacterized protein DI09_16p260 [Mitosporidium daphniae]